MRIFKYILMIILSFGCQSGSENDNHWGGEFSDLISAVDISYYPIISENGTLFYNDQGDQINFLNSLFEKGVNEALAKAGKEYIFHRPSIKSSSLW